MGTLYQPKERYYFGYHSRRGPMDDPFTLEDDVDRAHAALGFLLVVPNFLRLNLATLKDAVVCARIPVDPALASAVLVLAQEGEPPGAVLKALPRCGEAEAGRALEILQVLGWIRFRRHAGRLGLKPKGHELLREAGMAAPPAF